MSAVTQITTGAAEHGGTDSRAASHVISTRSVRPEGSSRHLRNTAVEHSDHDRPSTVRPMSTSTVATAQYAPLLGASEGDRSAEAAAAAAVFPIGRISVSPVRNPRPDASLLGDDAPELTVPSPTRSRGSAKPAPFGLSATHGTGTASSFSGSEPDSHQQYARLPTAPAPYSAGPFPGQRVQPLPFENTARSTSYSRPDRPQYHESDVDSPDDAVPPDFRSRRSSSTQQRSRARRTAPVYAPPTASPVRPYPPHPPSRPTAILSQLAVCSHLVFFSLLGTLARLGLQWLTFYPGAPVITSTLWANFAGSLFMGFLSEDKRLFRRTGAPGTHSAPASARSKEEHDGAVSPTKVKKTIPLYVGLTTGFCGSLTSFSSFERDVFLALSNRLPSSYYHSVPTGTPDFASTIPRNGGYSFMALMAVIVTEIGLSLAAVVIGSHLALGLRDHLPALSAKLTRRVTDRLMMVLGPGAWLGAILLAIFPPDRSGSGGEVWRGTVLFSLVFAPIGCLTRHLVSLKLNRLSPSFPLGTFSVNVFGCAVLAMCYDLQHVTLAGRAAGGGRTGCQVLQGVQDGFCGCLTTVSTFALELVTSSGARAGAGPRTRDSRRRVARAWLYGAASVVSGACVMIVILGSVLWTVGWSEPACATARTVL